MTVGPDSVGYKLTEDAIVFGGTVLTATDCLENPNIGKPELAKGLLTEKETITFKAIVQNKLERLVDTMKTSPEDLPVVLVGGGAIVAPEKLKGASKVLKPRLGEVANAVGAALARVSCVVDRIKSTEGKNEKQLLEEVSKEAIEKTVEAGAKRETVEIAEMETLPLQYVANKTRFIIRAVGDFDESVDLAAPVPPETTDDHNSSAEAEKTSSSSRPDIPQISRDSAPEAVDIAAYTPTVRNRIWTLSETDLSFISTGCYILGTGGGGSPYAHMILLRQLLRSGATVRIVSPSDLPDDAAVGCGSGAGSPTVSIEKLQGDEMMEAQTELYKMLPPNQKATHMMALEIGGGNGLQGLTLAASSNMDIPCVDGDFMGRAYPTKWQTTPVVFNDAGRNTIWAPIVMADGSGNVVSMPRASSDAAVERIARAAISEMGSQVAVADPPVSGAEAKRWIVEGTVSLAWRLGRAVHRARAEGKVDRVAEEIVRECGGGKEGCAKVLFKGKIVGVRRTLRKGHVYGECIIEGTDVNTEPVVSGAGVDGNKGGEFKGQRIKIPFKNENIAAIRIHDGGEGGDGKEDGELEKQEDVLAIVPDLISVIDAQNGEAVGTPEYRYGLLVVVVGISASDKWTATQRGIDIGGPKAFGYDHLEYKPLGRYVKPISVIDEFDVTGA